DGVLRGVLPSMAAELTALQRARGELDAGAGTTLDELLRRYDDLKERDPRRRRLIAPAAANGAPNEEPDSPLFCRILRRSLELEQYEQHLTILEDGSAGAGPGETFALESRVDAVERRLARMAEADCA